VYFIRGQLREAYAHAQQLLQRAQSAELLPKVVDLMRA
jgi:hypothetical protein